MFRSFAGWKISHRLLLLGVAFVPIAVMVFLIVTRINGDIQFSQFEKYGDDYQRPLEALLKSIPEHRLLAARFVAGDSQLKQQLTLAEDQIARAFEALEAVDAKL